MKFVPRVEHVFLGYLYTEFCGVRVSDVVRTLTQSGVPLYELRVNGDVCRAGFSRSDWDAVRHVCDEYGVEIEYIRKAGLPFFLWSLRHRKSMAVGVALFVVILFACQSVVWRVQVTGVDPEDAAAIAHAARQIGVYQGALKQTLPDVNQMQATLLDHLPNMMWIGVNVVGTEVRIQALKKISGVAVSQDNPHNIVAARPAVIRRVLATRGVVKVVPGQTVQPGTLLISGALGEGSKEVPASGVVLAEVWYRSEVEVPLHVNQNELTGQAVKFDTLQIGSWNLRVWGWRNPNYPAYYDEEVDTRWKLWNHELPVVWRQVTRYESTRADVTKSKDAATATALALARQDVLTKPGQDRTILGQSVLHTEVAHGKLYATILTRTEEDIGTAAPIPAPQTTEPGKTQS